MEGRDPYSGGLGALFSGLQKFLAALPGAEEVLAAVPNLSDRLFLGDICVADLVFHHYPGEALFLRLVFFRLAQGREKADHPEDQIEKKSIKNNSEDSDEHDFTLEDFPGSVNRMSMGLIVVFISAHRL